MKLTSQMIQLFFCACALVLLVACMKKTKELFHEPSEAEFILHDDGDGKLKHYLPAGAEGVDAAIEILGKANYERIQEIHEIKHRLDHLEKVHLHISDASSDSAVFRHEDGRYIVLWVNEDDAKEVIR